MTTKTISTEKHSPRKRAKASSAGEKSREATMARRRAHEHHWLLDAPNGPVRTGKCKLCGKRRNFPNSSEDSIWDGADGRSRWNDMGISRRRKSQDDPIAEPNVVTV